MTSRVEHLAEGVTLYLGDCMLALQEIEPNSIDACVCDPPYHLTAVPLQSFGVQDRRGGRSSEQKKARAGFMGKSWDGGDIAFRPDLWRLVFNALKPGAHLCAFGGTRTYHRMACAIEDAGFSIRDTLMYIYGSGFPKSLNVSKAIDQRRFGSDDATRFKGALAEAVKRSGKTRQQINIECGFTMRFDIAYDKDPEGWGCSLPTADQYDTICRVLNSPDSMDSLVELREWPRTRLERLYEVVGYEQRQNSPNGIVSAGRETTSTLREITRPGTEAAALWAGFGTALKPACEPIVLARKPLSEGTVAANVLKWGTGALNIDGCRVGDFVNDTPPGTDRYNQANFEQGYRPAAYQVNGRDGEASADRSYASSGATNFAAKPGPRGGSSSGRWPANIIHDGSDEVVGAFPDSAGQQGDVRGTEPSSPFKDIYGRMNRDTLAFAARNDSGSAARFFYTAKADSDDRLGSKHPTVKPVDLMQWLVRLVTPPKGVVLDCFAGTGTTGEAAFREGKRAVLIEREAEYQDDIRRRMRLAMVGPDERAREVIKQKMKGKPVDAGPLFGGVV